MKAKKIIVGVVALAMVATLAVFAMTDPGTTQTDVQVASIF